MKLGSHDLTTQWIAGEAIESPMDHPIVLHDPSDGSLLAHVARGNNDEANSAIRAARGAQEAWAVLSPSARGSLLRQGGDRLREYADSIAQLLVRETGKPLAAAQAETATAVDWIDELTHLAAQQFGRSVPVGHSELLFQHVTPRGVTVCLNTWNAPMVTAIEMAVANLAVGNAVVLKTSERAPLATRIMLQRCFEHLPAGVLNVLSGDGPSMGEALIEHSDVDVICFIGSVGVGRHIGEVAGRRIRKAILELGGKDALIVDETVDILAAAAFAGPSCFANSGQICTSTERIYVLRSVFEPFVEALCDVARALRIGPGLDPQTQMGPMIDEAVLFHVERQVDAAVHAGANLRCGGRRLDRPGSYFPPTVLTDVHDDTNLMLDETFGPVAPVTPVDSFDEAIELSNRSTFGLSAIVLTESASRAIQAIHQLRCGMVRINAPRGQVTLCCAEPAKNSGIGFGHGVEFLRELTHCKSVRWRQTLT